MREDRREFFKTVGIGAAGLVAGGNSLAHLTDNASTIHRVHHIPIPDYTFSNRHPGVDSLLFSLAAAGENFYKSGSGHPLAGPSGMIGADDIVLIKVNAQWKYRGCTNSDVVRGVIQRILEHPDGFTGEVVIIENGQGRGSLNCDTMSGCDGGTREIHANAENERHSFSWLVTDLFQDLRVGQRLLDDFRTNFIGANDHTANGYRKTGHVSYPCFNTPRGNRVELKEGLWTGSGYDSSRLKWINVATMKDHKDLNVTGLLKNTYGIITTWDEALAHHDPNEAGVVMGEVFSLVRPPVLNILDHIWVAHASLCGYPADTTTRRDMLCAGFDPCAIDSWSARHILYPISGDPAHDPDLPGYFRTYLLDARDTINAAGGIRGRQVTFDEAQIEATHQDQREISLGLWRGGPDIHLAWAGGRAPFRIEKSPEPAFATPQLVAAGVNVGDFTDFGAALGSTKWFYRVTGA